MGAETLNVILLVGLFVLLGAWVVALFVVGPREPSDTPTKVKRAMRDECDPW